MNGSNPAGGQHLTKPTAAATASRHTTAWTKD